MRSYVRMCTVACIAGCFLSVAAWAALTPGEISQATAIIEEAEDIVTLADELVVLDPSNEAAMDGIRSLATGIQEHGDAILSEG